VSCEDNFLPLLFVSSGQINAELVSNLAPGLHKLVIRGEGQAETAVDFEVARNAPGLFSVASTDLAVGIFRREGGDAITVESPARPGDVLTLFGTGFGPYQIAPPDGFLVDESAAYSLADALEVVAGGEHLAPLYAGRSNMGVGIDAVRFRVPVAVGSGMAPVKIIANGVESNSVFLPVAGDR
jgi:uncharacterized protein (TIGR03437 family)